MERQTLLVIACMIALPAHSAACAWPLHQIDNKLDRMLTTESFRADSGDEAAAHCMRTGDVAGAIERGTGR